MAAVARLGDCDSGHDACPPRASVSASPNVFVNGKALHRLGDSWGPHGCSEHSPHGAVTAAGSPNVLCNNRAAARIGDAVSCGGSVAQGSPNVYVNS